MHGIHEWVATSAMSNSLPTSPCRARIAGRGSRLILLRLCSSPPPSHLRHTTLPSISALRGKEEARAACVDSIISNVSNIYLLSNTILPRRSFQRENFLFFFFFRGENFAARIEARESLLDFNYAPSDLPTAKLYTLLFPLSIRA